MKGLEGKFYVCIKDFVLLTNENESIEIGGYVVKLSLKKVKLSHEHPLKRIEYDEEGRYALSRGDRTYALSGFTKYEVLKKANQE